MLTYVARSRIIAFTAVPDKPTWFGRISTAIQELEARSDPWVDRDCLEHLLGIGRRRAQQVLSTLAEGRIGTSLLARRGAVLEYLNRIAAGEVAYYEGRRRAKLWNHLADARRQWVEQPPVLVEMPERTQRRIELLDFEGLPAGVELAPGSITVRFRDPEEALRKLMALAMAIGRNREAFEQRVRKPDT